MPSSRSSFAGARKTAWANRKVLAVLSAARPSVTVPWPEGWGADSKCAAVFSYNGVVDDVDTYIQDHLVAQWDTSFGATETEWTDRIGGKKFALVNATLADGRYTFAGSTAYGSLDAESSSALLDNGTNTLEAVFSINGNTYALAGTQKSKIILANWQGQMILSGPNHSTCLPVGAGYSTYSVVYDEVKGDYPPHIARYLNGAANSNGTSYWSIGGTQLWLARSSGNTDSGGTVVFCALRIYDRQLTADEVAINAAIDKARFRGIGAATQVTDNLPIEYGLGVTAAVELSGVNCTVEGAGKYSVGQTVTVRAVPDERTKFIRWDGELPAGCSATASELQFVLTGPVTLRAVCGRRRPLTPSTRAVTASPFRPSCPFRRPTCSIRFSARMVRRTAGRISLRGTIRKTSERCCRRRRRSSCHSRPDGARRTGLSTSVTSCARASRREGS